MRLKIVDTFSQAESDSDYETGVDMSHWTMSVQAVLLESPGGVRFMASQKDQRTTYTYLEPDFDVMERTGETAWTSHPNPAAARESQQLRFSGLLIAWPARDVSLEEFKSAQRDLENNPWYIECDEGMPNDLKARLLTHLAGNDGRPTSAESLYVGHYQNVDPNCIHAEVGDAEMAALAAIHGDAGSYVDVELSPGLDAAIRAAEASHKLITDANTPIVSANRAKAASAKVAIVIDEMAAAAHRDIKKAFASVY